MQEDTLLTTATQEAQTLSSAQPYRHMQATTTTTFVPHYSVIMQVFTPAAGAVYWAWALHC